MKLGIITQPLSLNYGGILQAYALQRILSSLGHDVSIVSKKKREYKEPHGLEAYLRYSKRIVFRRLGLSDSPVFIERELNKQWLIVSENTRQFIRKFLHIKEVTSYSELMPDSYDGYIVGSDQVWRPAYNNLYDTYLYFTDGWSVKRIAYAASFGTDEKEYTAEQIKICKSLIQRFDAVSVREDSGVGLCREYFNVNAHHVLDPTMLLKKEDYVKIIEENGIDQSEGDMFVYMLDPSEDKTALSNRIAEEKHLVPFSVKTMNDYKYASIEKRSLPSVEQWLRGFFDAKFVVTDSFHGCVFSILFNKPFVVIGNMERGMARFDSLLNIFGLEQRLIKSDGLSEFADTPIDWGSINTVLDAQREVSFEFLSRSLY